MARIIPSSSGIVNGSAVVFENLPIKLQQQLLRNTFTTTERFRIDGGRRHDCGGACEGTIRNGEMLHVIAGVWVRCTNCYDAITGSVEYVSPSKWVKLPTTYVAA